MEQKIYQKQFTIGEILSESWKIFVANFREIFITVFIVYIPINIILYFIPPIESLDSFRFSMRIMQILEGLIGVFATMVIAYIVKNYIDSKEIDIKIFFKKSLFVWGVLFLTNLLLNVSLVILTLLLIIPGIIFGVYWIFVPLVVILKEVRFKAALDYSKEIVKDRWWTVLGYSIVFFLMVFLLVGIGGLLLGAFEGILFAFIPENIIISVIDNTILDVLYSFFTVVSVVFFINFDATKLKSEKKEEKEVDEKDAELKIEESLT